MMPITPIVKHLLIINVLVFIGMQLLPPGWREMLSFYSPVAYPEIYDQLGQYKPELLPYYMRTMGFFAHFRL